jgi:aspartyl-tRNA(Asn)/glutamyl-tRNA(Gln) amidotransferase subunit A
MTIGIPDEYRVEGMPDAIEKLWQKGIAWAEDAGCTIKRISLPHTKYALPTYYIVAPAEASSNLARYDGMRYGARVSGRDLNSTYEATRASGFGREVQRRIMIGTYVLSAGYYDAYYLRAQKVRARLNQDMANAFAEVDAILTPATPSAAFALGEKGDDPVAMYLNDIFTVTANLTGNPALALPAATDANGLPLGLQVIGKTLDEETVFAVSAALEKAANFRVKPTKWWA